MHHRVRTILRGRGLIAALLTASLIVAACGGDDDEAGGEDGGTTPTTAPEQTTEPPGSPDEDVEAMTIQVATELPPAYFVSEELETWADELESATDGLITVEIFPSAQLYTAADAIQLMSSGAGDVEVTVSSTTFLQAAVPEYAVLDLPFISDGTAEGWAAVADPFDSDLGRQLAEQARDSNIAVMTIPAVGRLPIAMNGSVDSLSDFDGTKIRSPGSGPIIEAIVSSLGATPVSIPAPEVASSMQQGAVDGAFGSYTFFLGVLADIATHVVDVGGLYQTTNAVLVDATWLDSLPEELQDTVTQTLRDMGDRIEGRGEEVAQQATQGLEDAGVALVSIDQAELDQLVNDTASIWDELDSRLGGDWVRLARELSVAR